MGNQRSKGLLATIIILVIWEITFIFGIIKSSTLYLSYSRGDQRKTDFLDEIIIQVVFSIILLTAIYFLWRKYNKSTEEVSITNQAAPKLLSAKIMQWVFIIIFFPVSVLLFVYTFTTVRAAFFIFLVMEAWFLLSAIGSIISMFISSYYASAMTLFYTAASAVYFIAGLPLLYFLWRNYQYLKNLQK